MFTIAFGIRFTLTPVLPWKPKFKHWFSFFWVHFMFRITLKELFKVVVKEVKVEVPIYKKARDSHKEKSSLSIGDPLYLDEDQELTVKKPQPMKPLVAGNVTKARPRVDGYLYHTFHGSQLTVGKTLIVHGLSNKAHSLEVTPDDQIFVDNIPYKFNPTDVQKIKVELNKLQKK